MVIRALPPRRELLAILETVKDPEVPVLNVVELGIVRDVRSSDDGVTVVVTPTYSGCPAMHTIEADIVAALRARGIEHVRMQTVYAPAWTTDWLSAGAKEKLRAYGIAPPGSAPDDELVALTRRTPSPPCPYCGSVRTQLRSEFGSTACKSICYCSDCRQPFEAFKPL
ncbi:MAG TPA: 1,2-phenylacetyl-CoA epoxidase subunit PaaD [Gemmatimonadaceae bacterium]|nr:1,2-phenylacetyl-CoA epoxidase subunit PaaD [Gemmatimonadaceae bacterium]